MTTVTRKFVVPDKTDLDTAVSAMIADIEAGKATEADLDALLDNKSFGLVVDKE